MNWLKRFSGAHLALFALAAQLGGLFGGEANGQQKTSADMVKVSAKAGKADSSGKQMIKITIAVPKGWYIYANPVGLELVEENKTVVEFSPKNAVKEAKITYPKGKIKNDTLGDYRIYQGEVIIEALVHRASEDPLMVAVRVNTCHERGVCLPPGTVTVAVK